MQGDVLSRLDEGLDTDAKQGWSLKHKSLHRVSPPARRVPDVLAVSHRMCIHCLVELRQLQTACKSGHAPLMGKQLNHPGNRQRIALFMLIDLSDGSVFESTAVTASHGHAFM